MNPLTNVSLDLSFEQERTKNLINGLVLLLNTYSDGVVSLNEKSISFVLPNTEDKLRVKEYNLLRNWNWIYGSTNCGFETTETPYTWWKFDIS